MIRPISKSKPVQCLNDFQVLKGECERTMKPFGQPVHAAHEARLIINDDREKLAAGSVALYVIHHRSENKIIHIVDSTRAAVSVMKVRNAAVKFPVPKAA